MRVQNITLPLIKQYRQTFKQHNYFYDEYDYDSYYKTAPMKEVTLSALIIAGSLMIFETIINNKEKISSLFKKVIKKGNT